MTKVIVIGIDALDWEILQRFIDDLPNFKKVVNQGFGTRMESIFPPDTDTIWTSIHTGLSPGRHGMIQYVDPLEKSMTIQTVEAPISSTQGKAFWDYASKYDRRVCVLLANATYPPWKVNGIMVSRSRVKDNVLAYPEQLHVEYDLSKINTPKGVPRKDYATLKRLTDVHKKLIIDEAEFFVKMLSTDDWGLFFAYTSSLDRVHHYMWNFWDENDPEYPGDNPFKDNLFKMYRLYDDMIGKVLATMDRDSVLIIVSDHGQARRPLKVININEVLRKSGLLSAKSGLISRSIKGIKSRVARTISKRDLGWLVFKFLKVFPFARRVYVQSTAIEPKATLAYATDLSGVKAYTYGGINIRRPDTAEDYEEIRDTIINIVRDIKNPITGERVVKSVWRREDIYHGEYARLQPDIMVEMELEYGIGQEIDVPILGDAPVSSLVPGSHRRDTAVFLVTGDRICSAPREVSPLDIAPTVLHLLDIEDDFDLDGKSILK
ncbi:MAG: alkaline phosphatase family protein [Dehalococcoidales bacterium]|nr:alkaline phosphatase family protein [Dehalococcoidales bacterium]